MPDIKAEEARLKDLLKQARELAFDLSPITPGMAVAAPTLRAAYSDRTCALMSALCLIAYDKFEDPSHVGLESMRLRLARGGFRLINTYDPRASTEAYLAVSEEFAVLAFRGTTDATDWNSNLNARLLPLDPERPTVRVHAGFLQAFREVQQDIRADLAAHVPASLALYITGHSLGGAIAQIAAAALARDNLAACYTFGSPRVSGRRFDREVKCPHYRVVNAGDIVPGVPPPVWRGYYHNGDVRWLGRHGDPPARYSRQWVRQFFTTLRGLAAMPFKRSFAGIDDHMIWNYGAKLAAVAGANAPPPPKTYLAMDIDEIQARFATTVYAASRQCGVSLDKPARTFLTAAGKTAAQALADQTPMGEGRAAAVTRGGVVLDLLVREAVDAAKTAEGVKPDVLTLAMLGEATRRLGPAPPFW